MTTKATLLVLAATCGILSMGPYQAWAYDREDNWCGHATLGSMYYENSTIARGFDPTAAMAEIDVGAAWWSEVQSNLVFLSPSVVDAAGRNAIFARSDPGVIGAECYEEAHQDPATLAYTAWSCGWHPSCDAFGCNLDGWYLDVVSNIPQGTNPRPPCGDATGWGMTRTDLVNGKMPLYKSITHEFGHALGLAHTSDTRAMMYAYASVPNTARIDYDDQDGLFYGNSNGDGYSQNYKPMKTVSASFNSPYTSLAFNTTKTVTPTVNVVWGPVIAGDPTGSSTRDYALAWVNTNRNIVVRTAKESANDDMQVVATVTTAEASRSPIGIAISSHGLIGVAWTGTDTWRTVNFMSSSDGTAWKKWTLSGYSALGGVSVTYDTAIDRWVMTWVSDRDDLDQTLIATTVSDDQSGSSWGKLPVYTWGDGLSMENNRPALVCGKNNQNAACLLLFSDFSNPAKGLSQQIFNMQPFGSRGTPRGVPWAVTYYNPNLVFIPESGSRPGTYIALWEQFSVSRVPLTYALLYESEVSTGTFHDWNGGPANTSRSGFAAAWNYRLNKLRFVWKDY
jgi:Matrixin